MASSKRRPAGSAYAPCKASRGKSFGALKSHFGPCAKAQESPASYERILAQEERAFELRLTVSDVLLSALVLGESLQERTYSMSSCIYI